MLFYDARYMGHKRTIRPNAKRLNALFMARDKMNWNTFARKVKSCQRGFMGEPEEIKPGRAEFHEYPSPCICRKPTKFLDVEKSYDQNQTSPKVPIAPEVRSQYLYNTDDQGAKSLQRLNKTSTIGEPVSLVEEKEDDDFLAD
ncbi:hypothetical protein RJ639_028073 [Escallonia herrerae]|uniref:Uncharacterized protein n=1 Tax=Escallonia herrerae TaxID=1293975 RepID=A0AA88X4Q1_9ASTE|nr:hypothetical protein RJ639_028073 [Escallonia herrerae]